MLSSLSSSGELTCDDQVGEHCPESSSWSVGDCLKAVPSYSSFPQTCQSYVSVLDACRSDVDARCVGKEYTGEVMQCLTAWTKPEDLSPACAEGVKAGMDKAGEGKGGKKEPLSAEDKKRASDRRKIRDRAANMAKEQMAREKGGAANDKGNGGKGKKPERPARPESKEGQRKGGEGKEKKKEF